MKFHDTLNEKIWSLNLNTDQYEMHDDVRAKLLEIADAFIDALEIPGDAILDIVVTGSSASYNYTEHSDIDLHIKVDFDKVHEDCPLVKGYLNAIKTRFNNEHDITIHEIPVELYAEGSDEDTVHNGLFSVQNNKWIDIPQKIEPTENDAAVLAKYNDLKEQIEQADDSEVAAALLEKIYEMRKAGLADAGEFSTENLAFKKLRDDGLLQKLRDLKKAMIDQQLSLEQQNEDLEESELRKSIIAKFSSFIKDELKSLNKLDYAKTCPLEELTKFVKWEDVFFHLAKDQADTNPNFYSWRAEAAHNTANYMTDEEDRYFWDLNDARHMTLAKQVAKEIQSSISESKNESDDYLNKADEYQHQLYLALTSNISETQELTVLSHKPLSADVFQLYGIYDNTETRQNFELVGNFDDPHVSFVDNSKLPVHTLRVGRQHIDPMNIPLLDNVQDMANEIKSILGITVQATESEDDDYDDYDDSPEEMHKERYVVYYETAEGRQKYTIFYVITDSTDDSYNELCDKHDNQLGMYDSYQALKDALRDRAEKIAAKQGWTVKSIDNLGEDEEYYRERNKWESVSNSTAIEDFKEMVHKIIADMKENGYPKSRKFYIDFAEEGIRDFIVMHSGYKVNLSTDNGTLVLTLLDARPVAELDDSEQPEDAPIYQARINSQTNNVKFSNIQDSNYEYESIKLDPDVQAIISEA